MRKGKTYRFKARHFYPVLILWYIVAIATAELAFNTDNDDVFRIAYLSHLGLALGWFVLIILKAGEVTFMGPGRPQVSSTPGHFLTIAAFILAYPIYFNWGEIAELFVKSPGNIRYEFSQQAEAVGLIRAEFHQLMDSMSADELVKDLYSDEQYQFLLRAFHEFPHVHSSADILGYGLKPPGQAFWLVMCLAVGLFGWWLRARKAPRVE